MGKDITINFDLGEDLSSLVSKADICSELVNVEKEVQEYFNSEKYLEKERKEFIENHVSGNWVVGFEPNYNSKR